MRLCIVQKKPVGISETFLQTHRNSLSGVVGVVYKKGDGVAIDGVEPQALERFRRAARRVRRKVSGSTDIDDRTSGYAHAFRKLDANVILAEYGHSGVEALGACRKLHMPLVVQFHGHDAYEASVLATFKAAYPEVFKYAYAIVAGCKSMAKALESLGADPGKIITNYVSLVDPRQFETVRSVREIRRFLMVGRLVEKKAPHLSILAFTDFLRQYPDAHLDIIGDGPLVGVCHDLVQCHDAAGSVVFHGARSRDFVAAAMRQADAFLQHSVISASGDREGTSISVLEAAAASLPIVATRHEGIAETMIDQVTAVLVDERDTKAMTEQMSRIAADPQFAHSLGCRASKRVSQAFTEKHSIERLNFIIKAAHDGTPIATVRDYMNAQMEEALATKLEA